MTRPIPKTAPPGRRPLGAPAWRWLVLTLLALLPAASDPNGVPAMKRLEVQVTAASGGSIYLDKGRKDGVAIGDLVLVHASAAGTFEALVRSVSKSSCRVELPPGAPAVAPSDPAEVLVPLSRLQEMEAEGEDEEPAKAVPDHPEWTASPEEWDGETPLLAAAWDRTPDEKPTRLRGRVFFTGQNTWDDEFGENEFTSARLGTEVFIENPWKDGGEIHFDGELMLRRADLEFGTDSRTTRGRLDRLSYSWGGDRQEESFYEVGRFLQNEFPELGVLDGGEYVRRLDSGARVGASFGYMPEQYPRMETGDDLQVAVFYRTDSDDPEDMVLGIAYQSTWHKGDADRNLVIGTLDWNPTEQLSLYGSAWVDYYGSGDDIKDDGVELTQFRLNGVYRIDQDSGVGAHVSHTRWPELLRNQLQSATAEQILDNETSRIGVSGWHRLAEDVRLDGRLDHWEDEDDSGGSGDIRLALRDMLYEKGEVAVAVFTTRGSFTEGNGLRLSANRSFGHGTFCTVSWENAQYEQDTAGADEDLDQQTVRASLDMLLGATRNLSLYAERRTGDSQDSKNLGVFFQQRF